MNNIDIMLKTAVTVYSHDLYSTMLDLTSFLLSFFNE